MNTRSMFRWLVIASILLAGFLIAPAQAARLLSSDLQPGPDEGRPAALGLTDISKIPTSQPSSTNVLVGGTIVKNTTWISSNVYVVTNNLGIAANVTLNIEPGTVISFTGNYTLSVGGTLLANGTQTHPIQFTSRPNLSWGRIYFNNLSVDAVADSAGNYQSGSLLRWTTIQRAGMGIGCSNATPFLEQVTLTGGGMNCAGGDTALWIKDSDLSGQVQIRTGSGVDSVLGAWHTLTSMTTARQLLGAAAGPNGILYAIGGTSSGGYQSVVEGYNPLTNLWETRADLPLARCCLGVAAAPNGRLYAIGGTNILTRVEEYDPLANTWAIRANLPTGRYMLGAAAAPNGKVYAIGGAYGDNKVEEYDPALDTWAGRANLPTGRSGLAVAAALNGKIYTVGGDGGMNTVEEYDPLANTWTARAGLPTPRRYLGIAAAQNGRIYAIGGDNGSTAVATVEEYDPTTNTWTTRASLLTARSGLAVVTAADGTIYAIGGANTSGDLASVEAYTFPSATFGYTIQNTIVRNGDLSLPETSQVISATVGGAISAGSSSVVQGCTTAGGITITGGGTVAHNTVTGGDVQIGGGSVENNLIDGGGIMLTGSVISNTISQNQVKNASTWGIFSTGSVTLLYNRIVGNANGIHLESGLAQENLIANSAGVGLQVKGATVLSNTLTANAGAAVLVDSGALTSTIRGNNIAFNHGAYILENHSANPISAEHNWWGTTDPDILDTLINDLLDDMNYGQVNYAPLLTGPAQTAPPFVTEVAITPNPVGLQTVMFDVYFSRAMDTGSPAGFDFNGGAAFTNQQWPSTTHYRAQTEITALVPNGTYTLTVSRAVDLNGFEIAPNTSGIFTVHYSTVRFSATAYTVAEDAGMAVITTTLDTPPSQTITITYATANQTAAAGSDYVQTSGTLTFTPGLTSTTFTVPILDDLLDETDKTLGVSFGSPTRMAVGIPGSASLTIVDNDGPQVVFETSAITLSEGAGSAAITVTLSYSSVQPISVTYATSAGTAAAGLDFTALSGSLVFAPGEQVKTLQLNIIDDQKLLETNETFSLILSNPSHATLGTPHQINFTIIENDVNGPAITVSAPADPLQPVNLWITTPAGSVQMTLEDVRTGGVITTLVTVTAPGLPPANFTLLETNYEITVSGVDFGLVTIRFPYSEADVIAAGVPEGALRLLYFENGVWKDITTDLDTNANIITGVTEHFSPFVIGVQNMQNCAISLNNGAAFTGRLNVQIFSNMPLAAEMLVSNDAGFTGAVWQPYRPALDWMINDPGNRIVTMLVYVRLREPNSSLLCSGLNLTDDIIFDPLAPSVNSVIVQPDQKAWLKAMGFPVVTLLLSSADQQGGSGVTDMQISTDANFSGARWQPFQPSVQITAQPGSQIFVRVRDGAGNISAPYVVNLEPAQHKIYLPVVVR